MTRGFRALVLVLLLLGAARGQGVEEEIEEYLGNGGKPPRPSGTLQWRAFDPTDGTRFARGLAVGLEWVDLSGGEGDVYVVHLSGSQPFGRSDELRIALDVPVSWADTRTTGSHVGFGDLRLQLGWRPWEAGAEDAWFAAFAFHVDLAFPTGSASKALGGGDWVVAPAAIAKFRLRRILAYLTGRWIYADAVRPGGLRGFHVPGVDFGANTLEESRVGALNTEFALAWEFDRRADPIHWFSVTFDGTWNLAGDRNRSYRLATRLGREIGDRWSFDLDFLFALGGDRTTNFALQFAFVLDF